MLYKLAQLEVVSPLSTTQNGGIPLSPFPMAQQVNLPACSPHCPFSAEYQAGKREYQLYCYWFLTRLGIKPKSTAPEADAFFAFHAFSYNVTCLLHYKRGANSIKKR